MVRANSSPPQVKATMQILTAFLAVLTVALHVLPSHAGQIPVVDGVIGGVPSDHLAVHKGSAAITTTPAATTPGKLRLKENSGVCETTPGVYQASGYGDISSNESIW